MRVYPIQNPIVQIRNIRSSKGPNIVGRAFPPEDSIISLTPKTRQNNTNASLPQKIPFSPKGKEEKAPLSIPEATTLTAYETKTKHLKETTWNTLEKSQL